MRAGLIAFLLLLSFAPSAFPQYIEKWSTEITPFGGVYVFCDIGQTDFDSQFELLYEQSGYGGQSPELKLIDGRTGAVEWSYQVDVPNPGWVWDGSSFGEHGWQCGPQLLDVDGDQRDEIVFYSYDNGTVGIRCFQAIGADTPIPSSQPAATVAPPLNRPNPFATDTAIEFQLGREMPIVISIYDVEGRLVRTLDEGRKAPGSHLARWDGRDEAGDPVASGIYFYSFVGDSGARSKMIVMR